MGFKIGDIVRLTREAISYKLREQHTIKYSIIIGEKITDINEGDSMILVDYIWYQAEHLELVPEESDFEYGEMVEVYSPNRKKRLKRFFICEAYGAKNPYICVEDASENLFKEGKKFRTNGWGNIRKLPHQLTRKEIAEKFGVSEDFILIDE